MSQPIPPAYIHLIAHAMILGCPGHKRSDLRQCFDWLRGNQPELYRLSTGRYVIARATRATFKLAEASGAQRTQLAPYLDGIGLEEASDDH